MMANWLFDDARNKRQWTYIRAKTLKKHKMLGIGVLTSVSHTIRLARKVCGVELSVIFCELLKRYSKEKATSLGRLFWPFLIIVCRRKLVLGAKAKRFS
jgi:hypothetical protein